MVYDDIVATVGPAMVRISSTADLWGVGGACGGEIASEELVGLAEVTRREGSDRAAWNLTPRPTNRGRMGGLSRDLQRPSSMILKAAMFLAITTLVGIAIAFDPPTSRVLSLAMYAVGVWAAARAYYFAFYVIERYCDPTFKYAGVWSAIMWVVRHRRRQ